MPKWACFLAKQAAQLGLRGLLHGVGASWGQLAEAADQTRDPDAEWSS